MMFNFSSFSSSICFSAIAIRSCIASAYKNFLLLLLLLFFFSSSSTKGV
ncbi:unnamed protein product [Tuber melanosporum]|uniref:(Perigord truffle) hypothetical protein n=1 Tax=Tuber melanosporum (strain Mel28) TaxID=656061 RepID=D5GGW4_TUBMM|nr:uncharacterized protein GSTUM_00002068001 [Tuber melanosporum]CAZ83757.1 unnamed protein product [Tuber melanosporum]